MRKIDFFFNIIKIMDIFVKEFIRRNPNSDRQSIDKVNDILGGNFWNLGNCLTKLYLDENNNTEYVKFLLGFLDDNSDSAKVIMIKYIIGK